MNRILLAACLLCLSPLAWSASAIQHLLDAATPPDGVVFEVVESDDDALDWAIPQINHYVSQLRARFPDIEIAVVTHGSEQFALTRANRSENTAIHQGVQSLVQDADVPVHVCGTHAGWFGVDPEDFPAFVDVAPAGPVQIHQYEELGYELVVVEADD